MRTPSSVAASGWTKRKAAALRRVAAAQTVVAEMAALASTSEEKQLARSDARQVAKLGQLLQRAETEMAFNLQYLQLQSAMQNENRSYTAISNIMKTKHDTVKNSISNIR